MPWSGGIFTRTNGTYTGSTVWQSDAAAAVKIRADRHDTHDQDIGQGINNTIAKDGQNSPTQNISWGGFKITSLGSGVAATDAAQFGQTITALSWTPAGTVTATRATGGNFTAVMGLADVNAAIAGGNITPAIVGPSSGVNGFQINWNAINVGNGGNEYVNNRGGGGGGHFWYGRTTTAGAPVELMALTTAGALSTAGSITATTSVNGATAAISGAATVGSLSSGGGVTATTGFTGATAAISGTATVGSITAATSVNGATAAISGAATVGSITPGGGRILTQIVVTSSAPGALANGVLHLRY